MQIDAQAYGERTDASQWPRQRAMLEAVFAAEPRNVWEERLQHLDSCFAPVLAMAEAPGHPHNRARNTFYEDFGVVQPSPSPRFGGTPASRPARPPRPGEHTDRNSVV